MIRPTAGPGYSLRWTPSSVALPRDSLLGRSGKLRARFLLATRQSLVLSVLRHFFGDTAGSQPGVYALQASFFDGHPFSLITLLPFTSKARGRVGVIGSAGGRPSATAFTRPRTRTPNGFIRVTPDNEDTPVSEHFRLRDFLTHDQQDVWPKYIVLREALVDKLELIIDDLATHGHPDAHLVVMSGFRTPAYNALGIGARGGRARDSRHQFGDAADIYVDNDGDGMMDDLNGDGRTDSRDARVLLASSIGSRQRTRSSSAVPGVSRCERAWPVPPCRRARRGRSMVGRRAAAPEVADVEEATHTWPRPERGSMNPLLRDRIVRSLETMSDERAYQVLDYVEFLESKYAQRPALASAFERFAEGIEDTLRAGRVPATAVAETMTFLNKAVGVLSGVAAAGKSVASDIVQAATKPASSNAPQPPSGGNPPLPPALPPQE